MHLQLQVRRQRNCPVSSWSAFVDGISCTTFAHPRNGGVPAQRGDTQAVDLLVGPVRQSLYIGKATALASTAIRPGLQYGLALVVNSGSKSEVAQTCGMIASLRHRVHRFPRDAYLGVLLTKLFRPRLVGSRSSFVSCWLRGSDKLCARPLPFDLEELYLCVHLAARGLFDGAAFYSKPSLQRTFVFI